ncbi:primosomal protein N' [Planctomycetota bacterium]
MTPGPDTDGLFAHLEGDPASPCSHCITVAFDSAADTTFTYQVPDSLWPVAPGQRIEAPFGRGNKPQTGFCVTVDPSINATPERSFKLKAIRKVIDDAPLVDVHLLELAQWISSYYVCPLGQVLSAVIPGAVKHQAGVKTERFIHLAPSKSNEPTVRGKKQRAVLDLLQTEQAHDPESALAVSHVRKQVGCTGQPIKRLAKQGQVRLVKKTSLPTLPVLPTGLTVADPTDIQLNADQQAAVDHLHQQLETETFGVTVLYGVTDSGKTEVYIRAIERTITLGKGAIVLLPEIALTTQTVQRFQARFENVAVMHSGLSGPQRHAQWQMIRSGKADIVVGARSAIFAPLPHLGLIVVDEEHEPSYKQDTTPRYHARDLAVKRTQLIGAHCILGSATPSLESLTNCTSKKAFQIVKLPHRVNALAMPKMIKVDLRSDGDTRHGSHLISAPLAEHLQRTLAKGQQAMLLLNRRGYSNFVFCPSCKHTLHCRNCDVTLTFHKADTPGSDLPTVLGKHLRRGYAICHYCLAQTLVPKQCPLCSKGMAMIGLGSQRLEDEVTQRFPEARIARLDSDAMAGKDYLTILRDFSEGRIQILAGTQMLAKGLHFPNVTLVGIISADTSLYIPDFRANERTYQLISQVAGRAGRSTQGGTVFVQTFLPDQPAIRYALAHDFEGFVKEEVEHRHSCSLPPFWRLAAITLKDTQFEKLERAAKTLRDRLDQLAAAFNLELRIRGPMPAPISRIQRFHRIQIIVQAPNPAEMQSLFARLRTHKPIRPQVHIAIDIDPVHVL